MCPYLSSLFLSINNKSICNIIFKYICVCVCMFRVIIIIAREREAVWSSKMVMCSCMNSMFVRRAMIIFVGKRERHLPADKHNNQWFSFMHIYMHFDLNFLYRGIIQRVSSFCFCLFFFSFSISTSI